MRTTTFYLLLLLPVVSCVKLPAPEINPPKSYLFGERFSRDSLPYEIRWWHHFNDPHLNRLEEQALRQNLNLAEAAARIEAARQNLQSARAEYLPSLGLSIEGEGGRTPAAGITQSYTVAPTISWELPLFGRMRAARGAARASLLSEEWNFRGVILSLTAEVATTYFSLLEYSECLKIAEDTRTLRSRSAALIDSLVRYGMKSRLDLDQAQSLLLSAESDCHQYRNLKQQSEISLSILLSENPHTFPTEEWRERLYEDQLPPEVPIGLPSALLLRRPDVMASYYALDLAAARVGAARAARLPGISLTVEGGRLADDLHDLVRGDKWLWSIAGSITQPLFSFGRLKAAERMVRENYHEALFAYEGDVLQAIADVEGALSTILQHREQLTLSEEIVALNEEILRKNRALYRAGMTAYLDLLDAERSAYASRQTLASLRAGHFIDYINLYKALGGGW